jgi:hypothetical protein
MLCHCSRDDDELDRRAGTLVLPHARNVIQRMRLHLDDQLSRRRMPDQRQMRPRHHVERGLEHGVADDLEPLGHARWLMEARARDRRTDRG